MTTKVQTSLYFISKSVVIAANQTNYFFSPELN